MRVPINLASQPYENLRPLYSAAGVAVVLLAGLALLVGWNVRQNRNETRVLAAQSDRLERDLRNLLRERRELEQWLARPEVEEIRDRSAFLNSIIVHKSLSWTQMFMDLEKILPERVQVTAIRPSLNQSLKPELKLTVSAASVQPLVEFLKDLESASEFGAPVVQSERYLTEKAADASSIVLDLSVLYHQDAGVPAASSQEGTKEAAGKLSAPLPEAAPEQPAGPSAPPAESSAPSDVVGLKPGSSAPSDAPVWNPKAPALSDVLGRKQPRPRRGAPLSEEEER